MHRKWLSGFRCNQRHLSCGEWVTSWARAGLHALELLQRDYVAAGNCCTVSSARDKRVPLEAAEKFV